MTSISKTRLTATEYLAIERKADTRSEFFAGEMFAMSGVSREHILISVNLSSALSRQLKDRPCEVDSTDMRVRVPSGLYTYPDVVVVCGNPKFEDDTVAILLNPLVLIEVLSESTRRLRSRNEVQALSADIITPRICNGRSIGRSN